MVNIRRQLKGSCLISWGNMYLEQWIKYPPVVLLVLWIWVIQASFYHSIRILISKWQIKYTCVSFQWNIIQVCNKINTHTHVYICIWYFYAINVYYKERIKGTIEYLDHSLARHMGAQCDYIMKASRDHAFSEAAFLVWLLKRSHTKCINWKHGELSQIWLSNWCLCVCACVFSTS